MDKETKAAVVQVDKGAADTKAKEVNAINVPTVMAKSGRKVSVATPQTAPQAMLRPNPACARSGTV